MKLSILTAVYNENQIKDTVSSWIDYLSKQDQIDDYEIILCDDCSEWNYYQNMENAFNKNRHIKLLRNHKNEGPGYSFSRCMKEARFEYSLITDSDGQFPIENLGQIMQHLQDKKQPELIFFTYRNKKYDNAVNVFGQKLSNLLCNFIYKSSLQDFTCAFKFVPTKVLKLIRFDAKYMNYSLDHSAKLLETGIDHIDLPITCEIKKARKRGLFKELKRAFDRFLYIYYLWVRKYLMRRRVLFQHHQQHHD